MDEPLVEAIGEESHELICILANHCDCHVGASVGAGRPVRRSLW